MKIENCRIMFSRSCSIRGAGIVMSTCNVISPKSELAAVEFSAGLLPGYFFSAPDSF